MVDPEGVWYREHPPPKNQYTILIEQSVKYSNRTVTTCTEHYSTVMAIHENFHLQYQPMWLYSLLGFIFKLNSFSPLYVILIYDNLDS